MIFRNYINKQFVLIALLGMLVVLAGIRLPLLNRSPVDFWTVRQYPSLIIARDIFRVMEVEVADPAMLPKLGGIEFPLREWLAANIYRMLGGEAYWPLTVTSLMGWCIGAFFAFRLAEAWQNRRAAWFAAVFMMVFPYGFLASVGIMPDVLMTGLLMVALWSIYRYGQSPTWSRFYFSAGLSALALFVKPGVTQFAIGFSFLFVALQRDGLRSLLQWRNYGWAILLITPAAICMALNWNSGTDWISRILFPSINWGEPIDREVLVQYRYHPVLNIKPEYLLVFRFWKAWLGNLIIMFGVTGVMFGVAGILMMLRKSRHPVLAGYFLGYLVQCCFTTWTTMAHDYWHLQVVPLFAIGVGVTLDAAIRWSSGWWSRKGSLFTGALSICWLFYLGYTGYMHVIKLDDQAWYQEACREIGEATGNSRKCVIMDWDSGSSLKYFADIDGQAWPDTELVGRMRRDRLPLLQGWEQQNMQERLHGLAVRHQVDEFDYFVILRKLDELEVQPDLAEYLSSFPVVAEGYRYRVWMLEKQP